MKRSRRYPGPLRLLTIFLGHTGYLLGVLGFLLMVLPLTLVLFPSPKLRMLLLRKSMRFFLIFLVQWWLPVLRIYRFRAVTGEILPGEGPVIYVANHIGVLDAPMMLSFVSNTSVVIKQKHARLPIYAALVKYVDFISTRPGSLESLGRMYSDCLTVLKSGTNVLIFPEGTRSRRGKLQAFRDSAFRLSAQTGYPIVPVALFSEVPFMTKGWKSYFPPERFAYEVRFLPPVFSEKGERPMEFAERVRKMIANELKKSQAITVDSRKRDRV